MQGSIISNIVSINNPDSAVRVGKMTRSEISSVFAINGVKSEEAAELVNAIFLDDDKEAADALNEIKQSPQDLNAWKILTAKYGVAAAKIGLKLLVGTIKEEFKTYLRTKGIHL